MYILPTPVFLPGKVHGQRSLAGCSPWGYMTEHVCVHEGGGSRVGSNKLVELKKKKKQTTTLKLMYSIT